MSSYVFADGDVIVFSLGDGQRQGTESSTCERRRERALMNVLLRVLKSTKRPFLFASLRNQCAVAFSFASKMWTPRSGIAFAEMAARRALFPETS